MKNKLILLFIACLLSIAGKAQPCAINGPMVVCVHSSITLIGISCSGSAVWSSTTSAATVNPMTGVVTGVSAGTTIISYSDGTPYGTGTYPVTVNALPPSPLTGPSSVCAGSSITLTETVSGGVWSQTGGSAIIGYTGIVSGVSPGVTTFTYSTGCGANVSHAVTVNAVPVIGGPANICVGATAPFTTSIPGGLWTSSSTNASIGSGTGIVTGVSAGPATITYISPGGCMRTVPIVVQALPSLIGGLPTVCAGSVTFYTDPTSGGTWSASPSATGTIDAAGDFTAISAGTATITYTSSGGCFVNLLITVNPSPVPVSGPYAVCTGSITLYADATPGGTWSASPSTQGTIDASGNFTALSPGPATITYTLSGGCSYNFPVIINPLPLPISGPGSVCQGSTSSFTDGTSGGTWSASPLASGTIDASGNYTAIAPGSANIIYTLPGGCFVTMAVVVNPTPLIIGGATSLCTGTSSTYSDATSGGTWSASPSAVGTIDASGNFTAISVGLATITYTLPGGCFAIRPVIINPMPLPIIGPGSVCGGSTTLYNDPTPGGTWSVSPPTLGSIDASGNFTATAPGTVIITYKLPGGCLVTEKVVIDSLPLPVTGPSSVCMGSTASYSDGTSGGTWSAAPSATGTIDAGGTLTPVNPGPVMVTYTLPTGCSVIDTVIVYSMPLPISGATSVCEGSTTLFTDPSTGGTWSASPSSTGTIDMATGIFTGISSGPATVTYTTAGGCFVTTPVNVDITPAPITGGSICLGSTTLFTDGTPGGFWSVSTTATGTIDIGGTFTPITVGPDTITYTLTTGCFAGIAVTVYAPPTISGPTSLCDSSTITLAGSGTGYWNSGTGAIASVDSFTGVVTGVSAGIDVITFTDSITGCSATYTDTVTSYTSEIWLGGTSTDWNTASNWGCGHIPMITEDVFIPSGTTYAPSLATGGVTTGYSNNLTLTHTSGAATTLSVLTGYMLHVAGNLLLNNNTVLSMGNTTESHVNGNVDNEGSVTGNGKLVMDGSSAQTIQSTGTGAALKTISNLEISNNVSIVNSSGYDSVGITKALTFDTSGTDTLTTNGRLVMCSDSIATARIDQIPSGTYVSGLVTCRQYIPGGHDAWRFFGHPFDANLSGGLSQIESGIDISGLDSTAHCFVTATGNAATAYYYITALSNAMLANDTGWRAYTSACGGAPNDLGRYQGIRILVRGARGQGLHSGSYTPSATTFQWTGDINQGDQNVPVATTTATATSVSTFHNFSIPLHGYTDYSQTYNMIGNPYACPIDIADVLERNYIGSYDSAYSDSVHGTDSSILYTPYFWLYQPDMGTSGQYLPQSFHNTHYCIPAGTMFEVRMNPRYYSGLSADIVFHESDKVAATTYTGTNALLRESPEFTVLNVTGPGGRLWDVVKLQFNEAATASEDVQIDASKRMGFNYNFFTVSQDNHPLSYDFRPFSDGQTVPLGMNGVTSEHLAINVSSVAVPAGKNLYLHDKLLEKYELLQPGMEYPFDFDATSNTQGDRFELAMKKAISVITGNTDFTASFSPNPAKSEINIICSGSATDHTNIRLLDVTGRMIQSEDAGIKQNASITMQLPSLASGVYLVEISCGKSKVVQKLIKE